MKNKNTTLNTVIQAATLVVIIVFSVWLSMGFKIDLTAINKEFFLRVGFNLVVSLFCYNTIFAMFFGNLARNDKCRYFLTVATKKIRVEKIYEHNRHDDLSNAVNAQNEIDLRELRNYKIRVVCSRLSYDDVDGIKTDTLDAKIKEWANLYALNKFMRMKLKRVIKRILSGKIKVDKLTPNDILTEKESQKLEKSRFKVYAKKRTAARNIKKSFKSLIFAGGLAIISFSPSGADFIQTLMGQLSLFLMAASSGLIAAINESKFITDIYDVHNKFIMQNLGINDTYISTEN